MLALCEGASQEGISIYLYGSRREVVSRLSVNLQRQFPGLKIAGVHPDRFRDSSPEEDAQDIQTIQKSGAGLVFVGRGCPQQERWVADHINKINAVMVAVGAAFDFIAGSKAEAPVWMQRYGLEWLFRLLSEPRRLWKRYLILNLLYLGLLFLQVTGLKTFQPVSDERDISEV